MSKVFLVYKNDSLKTDVIDATKSAAKKWVRENVLSTHIGEWRKTSEGYEYATSIGAYYQFRRHTLDQWTI